MTTYWCRFFDASGRIYGAEALRCENDADAVAKARVIHSHRIGSGYEICDGERLVVRVTYPRLGASPSIYGTA